MPRHRFADLRLALAALAMVVATSAPAHAQVISLTVGLNTPCPYGVAN